MKRDRTDDKSTLISREHADQSARRLSLLIVADGVVATHALPDRGDLAIGRSPRAEVRIHTPRISRRHAILHVGEVVTLEDLGSANGTRVCGRALPSGRTIQVAPGDVIELGEATVVLQHRAPARPGQPASVVDRISDGDAVVIDGAIRRLFDIAVRIAASDIHVLLLGETGVGKDILAQHIHRSSPRRAAPLVPINCAALNQSLVESELFGHDKGAFTGADRDRAGLLETAAGGTVFLDEVGDLPLVTQAKLLRVLEDRSVARVGSSKRRNIDVRFIAATNRDLEAEVARGNFRSDLYYRLSAVTLFVPPLRERVAEIESLARTFVEHASHALDRRPPEIADTACALLRGYAWPGNVRELRNMMERAVVLATNGTIGPQQLPAELGATKSAPNETLRAGREAYERQLVVNALERSGGNQTAAAKLLGIGRRTLVDRIERYGLPRPRKR